MGVANLIEGLSVSRRLERKFHEMKIRVFRISSFYFTNTFKFANSLGKIPWHIAGLFS